MEWKMNKVILISLLFGVAFAASVKNTHERKAVSPKFLDQLLTEKRYDEFDEYVGITVPNLSRPNKEGPSDNPEMNENLFEGDIILPPGQEEQGRQGIRFERYPGSRWPGNPASVPYAIASSFSSRDRNTIQRAIDQWNEQIECVKLTERDSEDDYVLIFQGNGCYSNLGRVGGQQPLSLGNGCVSNGIVLHEFEHAVGISHEHNRSDRDEYVEVLWRNISPRWRSQYRKNNPDEYGLQQGYNYYSIMHYPLRAPGSTRPAFRILQDGIEGSQLGQRSDFTDNDKQKIEELYC